MKDRGSGRSKLERELKERAAADADGDDDEDDDAVVASSLQVGAAAEGDVFINCWDVGHHVDLAARRAVAPRIVRWTDSIIVCFDKDVGILQVWLVVLVTPWTRKQGKGKGSGS